MYTCITLVIMKSHKNIYKMSMNEITHTLNNNKTFFLKQRFLSIHSREKFDKG
jgi:hypothetical protein